MTMKPTVLITGASGFSGRHACEYFSKSGYHVIAVSRKRTEFPVDIQVENCDLTNKKEVEMLIQDTVPQYVLHLAGQNHVVESWLDPITTLEVNVMSTAILIEALRKYNMQARILIVTSSLQFDPINAVPPHPYSLSKTLQSLVAKAWVDLYKMDIMIAKPTNLIGPGFSNGVCSIFARKIIAMEENKIENRLEVNNMEATRDFIDVRDVVRAYEMILKSGKLGEIYDISSGNCHSLQQILYAFKNISSVEFVIHSLTTGSHDTQTEVKPIKIQRLGWEQTFTLEESLMDIVRFYRDNREKI